jgi:hypothetical protein
MRLSFGCGAFYCCDPHGFVRQHHFGEATPPSEIADQPRLAKFGVGGSWPREMTTGELAAVIHCYPTQMDVIQRAAAEAAG